MKERFDLILEYYCKEVGITVFDCMSGSRRNPIPEVKCRTIRTFKKEFEDVPDRVISEWLNLERSTITEYRNKTKLSERIASIPEPGEIIKDYSKFVSFGYDDKIRFRHKYV